jgi:DNA repair exonuclease SbcCD ATPase subunit
VLVGIVSQAYLRQGEAEAVMSLNQPGRRIMLDELEYTTWKDYRAYLRALPDYGAMPPTRLQMN